MLEQVGLLEWAVSTGPEGLGQLDCRVCPQEKYTRDQRLWLKPAQTRKHTGSLCASKYSCLMNEQNEKLSQNYD